MVAVSAIYIWTTAHVRDELKAISQNRTELRAFADTDRWRVYLYEETLRRGLTYSDFRILREVVQCESSWRQYRSDGQVIVSSGNIGLAQINRFAHEAVYQSMRLDPEIPEENLSFAIYLYERDGLAPWRLWSGWCWLPKVEKFL